MNAEQLKSLQAPIKGMLLELTARYCVVLQTIRNGPPVKVTR